MSDGGPSDGDGGARRDGGSGRRRGEDGRGPDGDDAPSAAPPRDPYAVLNVTREANDDAVQRAYKTLSRAFHPDKQPAGPRREEAREAFVELKGAHDILSDPVLRAAYDDHGHYGVYFLRRIMNSADSALFHTLSKLHGSGDLAAARDALNEAIQFSEYQTLTGAVHTSGGVELRCNALHGNFLGMGEGPERGPWGSLPEVERASVSFSASAPRKDGRLSMAIGGQSAVKNGEGEASGQVSVGYSPVQGTDLNFEVDAGESFKVSVGSTRMMSTRTLITTNVSTVPNSDKLALSVSSQRALFQNTVRGMWAVGMGSDLSLHYGLLSFTTLGEDGPRCTAKLSFGIDGLPLKLSARHDFSDAHAGQVSCGWGTSGVELVATSTRDLSNYARFSIGVRHATERGLSWLLRLQRGDVSLSIPILVSGVASPGYPFKLIYLSLLSHLIDEAVGEVVGDARAGVASDPEGGADGEAAALHREESLIELNKARRDAQRQKELMTKPAAEKRRVEEGKDGLVILRATYSVEGGDCLDVTTQLQFWVVDSMLRLPSSPKSNMLGFYDVRPTSTRRQNSESKETGIASMFISSADATGGSSLATCWRSLLGRIWPGVVVTPSVEASPTPSLMVRYSFGGGVFETTVADNEGLVLPSSSALRLGESSIVS